MSDPRLSFPAATGPKLSRQFCTSPFASIVRRPNESERQLTELVFGQGFEVHEEREGWLYGRVSPLINASQRLGYVGWVRASDILQSVSETKAAYRLSVVTAPIFSEPDLKSPIRLSIPYGSLLSGAMEEGYLALEGGGYIHQRHIKPMTETESDIVTAARTYLGQPYIWGGNGGRGIDCSGLIQMGLAACGIDAPRDTDQQESALGEAVTVPEEVGDLLFWKGHVGLLSAPDTLLHANAYYMSVIEEPLKPALKRLEAAGLPLRSIRRLR